MANWTIARADAELATARSDTHRRATRVARVLANMRSRRCWARHLADFTMGADPLQSARSRAYRPGCRPPCWNAAPTWPPLGASMAAANARIGVARAACFPQLQLTGGFGYESRDIGDLHSSGAAARILGPLVGTALSLPIFDGGARSAGVKQARAAYEENVANYRESVLVAFREVERQPLRNCACWPIRPRPRTTPWRASTRAAQLSRTRYNAGSVNYLDVIDAERNMRCPPNASACNWPGSRVNSTVGLIKALGGGWGDLPPAGQANVATAAQPATVAQQ
ncbi:TolC family protein [Cupriavidus basilensis]